VGQPDLCRPELRLSVQSFQPCGLFMLDDRGRRCAGPRLLLSQPFGLVRRCHWMVQRKRRRLRGRTRKRGSRRCAIVVPQQTSEESPAADMADGTGSNAAFSQVLTGF
jgi:hypothetical protein